MILIVGRIFVIFLATRHVCFVIHANIINDEKIVGLSISQWLPCPLAIWNLLFGMAVLLNVGKH